MSENETLPPIVKAPVNASPESLAAADAMYERVGYSKEQRTAAGYNGSPAVIPSVKEVTQPGSDTGVRVPHDGLTRDQRVAGYKHALQFVPDKEAVIASAERDGIARAELEYVPPSQEQIQQARRDAEVADAMAAPASANDYQLTFDRNFAEATDITELVALAKDFKGAFKHAGVPTVLAQPLLDAILATGEVYADEAMTDAGRELRFREEGALFRNTSRDPQEDARLAQLGYNALPKTFRETLDANYSLHSARVQVQLAALGRAIEYRASRAKGKH